MDDMTNIIAGLSALIAGLGWAAKKWGGIFLKTLKIAKITKDAAELKADPEFERWCESGKYLFKKHFGDEGDVLEHWIDKVIK